MHSSTSNLVWLGCDEACATLSGQCTLGTKLVSKGSAGKNRCVYKDCIAKTPAAGTDPQNKKSQKV
eukprot:4530597-Amphidinium_carterae.1